MALFKKQAKKEEKKNVEARPSARTENTAGAPSLADVLRHARITEKATDLQGASVYTFDIAPSATKREVMAAVRALYKVTPIKVRVATIPTKTTRNMRTGKTGVKSGGKKAYVYLKAGETITS